MNSTGSRYELQRVSGDAGVSEELRTLSVAYLQAPPLPQTPRLPAASSDQPKSLLGSNSAQ
jgi:hypothetical protein